MSDAPNMAVPKIRVRTRQNFPEQVKPVPEMITSEIIDAGQSRSTNQPQLNTYQVGYGHPPKHSQFQKGVSGNKKGRPKGSRNASTIAQDLLARKSPVTLDGKRQKITNLEIGLLQQMKRATEKADLKSLQYLTSLAEPGSLSQGLGAIAAANRAERGTFEAPDPHDLAILAYHRREQMLAQGVSPDIVDLVMSVMDLGVEEPTP